MNPHIRKFGLIAIIVTIVAYVLAYFFTTLSYYLLWILAWSVATFVLYGLDKLDAWQHGNAAKNRVPKNLLHGLALVGGFGGGWAGMLLFWHKVNQRVFWLVLIASTLLHIGLGQFF